MIVRIYNEIDPVAAASIQAVMDDGVIPCGLVDTRSIKELTHADLEGRHQAHFFAGAGAWAYAARLAGWPDWWPLWTGSCPCQPFSQAGQRRGVADERHLWPDFFRLIKAARPLVVVGEQVAGKAGYGWLDGVRTDLEEEGYSCRAVDIPACAVDAPNIRQRLYWVALAGAGLLDGRTGPGRQGDGQEPANIYGQLVNATGERWGEGRAEHEFRSGRATASSADAPGVTERKNGNNQRRYHRIRREVLSHYSGGDIKCACCGERQFEFLALDHINGGGNAEKQRVGSRMRFRHLQLAGYPDGYQVLCHNCNQAKHIYGECPHRAMGDAFKPRLERQHRHGDGARGRAVEARPVAEADDREIDLADADLQRRRETLQLRQGQITELGGRFGVGGAGPLGDTPAPRSLPATHAGIHRGEEGQGPRDAEPQRRNGSFWSDHEWLVCHDGKARRTKPGLRLLADGVAGRVHQWRIAGNGINIPLAVEVLAALKDTLIEDYGWTV